MPTSTESRCLPATYHPLPGSSPTSTVPRPGVTPASRRRVTRSRSSPLIVAAVALPSSIRAVTERQSAMGLADPRRVAHRASDPAPNRVTARHSTVGPRHVGPVALWTRRRHPQIRADRVARPRWRSRLRGMGYVRALHYRDRDRFGISRRRLSGPIWTSPTHGVYLLATDVDDLAARCRAVQLALPDDAVFTHITAAALRGWWLPSIRIPLVACSNATAPHLDRRGVYIRRCAVPSYQRLDRSGLRIASAERTLLELAEDLSLVDLVIAIDAALYFKDTTLAALSRAVVPSRRGVRPLRPGARPRRRSKRVTVGDCPSASPRAGLHRRDSAVHRDRRSWAPRRPWRSPRRRQQAVARVRRGRASGGRSAWGRPPPRQGAGPHSVGAVRLHREGDPSRSGEDSPRRRGRPGSPARSSSGHSMACGVRTQQPVARRLAGSRPSPSTLRPDRLATPLVEWRRVSQQLCRILASGA